MEVIRSVARMRNTAHRLQEERLRVGLVPTRGGVHDGHLALVRKAQELTDTAIVAIVSSPAAAVDSAEKRRSTALTQAVELLAPTGVNYVFAPKREELYLSDECTEVTVRGLTERLFGSVRPGYYTDVATLLVKLFNIVGPDVVMLGQKDPQVVAITRRLITDLHFPCQVMVQPTVREQDGVAASHWLSRMTAEQRQAATLIYKALEQTQVLYGAGEREAATLIKAMREILEPEPLVHPDYLGVVDQETLEPLASIDDRPALVAIAATVGDAHLIDNIILNE